MRTVNIRMWGALWRDRHPTEIGSHLVRRNLVPVIFKTRRECREWVRKHYGYIKTRKDLRTKPHYWRLPRPVKLLVSYQDAPEPVDAEKETP